VPKTENILTSVSGDRTETELTSESRDGSRSQTLKGEGAEKSTSQSEAWWIPEICPGTEVPHLVGGGADQPELLLWSSSADAWQKHKHICPLSTI
jgi:hypothetical protein